MCGLRDVLLVCSFIEQTFTELHNKRRHGSHWKNTRRGKIQKISLGNDDSRCCPGKRRKEASSPTHPFPMHPTPRQWALTSTIKHRKVPLPPSSPCARLPCGSSSCEQWTRTPCPPFAQPYLIRPLRTLQPRPGLRLQSLGRVHCCSRRARAWLEPVLLAWRVSPRRGQQPPPEGRKSVHVRGASAKASRNVLTLVGSVT